MMKFFIYAFILILISACSFKAKPDEWKYKSTNAFNSYTDNFLSHRDALAKNDLKRAIAHAKQSANLTQLSRIYLAKCALNISVGIADECLEYKNISALVEDETLSSYYDFISSSLKLTQIDTVDARYKDFAKYSLASQYTKAKEEVFDMDKMTSKLLSASLIKNKFTFEELEVLINEASFYGYKKSVIFWLNVQKSKTTDDAKRSMIEQKIKVLE